MLNFQDKVAIVTGASAGIGRATAMAFAEQGARVVVADINQELGEATAADIHAKGGKATFMLCDVTKEADVIALVDGTLETYGKLDMAFN
ncbi:MAG: SDR family NAD(P)-dependent oxidoreductase, partial [Bermanella sp.]